MKKLILASASPRRSELLQQINLAHTIQVADIDETPWANEKPVDYVLRSLLRGEADAKISFFIN
jgi:septum formation protein